MWEFLGVRFRDAPHGPFEFYLQNMRKAPRELWLRNEAPKYHYHLTLTNILGREGRRKKRIET